MKMAENGVNGHKSGVMEWKVGFMNNTEKYLTAETFGFKVNASGVALKKKQIWTIEQEQDHDFVYIRSSLGRYMKSDKYGTVTVDTEAEEKGEDAKFTVEYSKDGQWAFRHVERGNYLSGTDDIVKCFEKTPTSNSWWSIQLYIHPQIHLRNVNRKRYAHLNNDTNELECTELIPWGADALVFLDFVKGKYVLKSCDNRFLNRDGSLQEAIDNNALFMMEIHSGALAFKDCEGRYLTAVGKGTMKGRNKNISKDELFTIEDSHPQVQIVSHNGKSVSVKQGVDVSANQPAEEIEDTEIFQIEHNRASDTWALLASTNKYWSLQSAGTVQAKTAETEGAKSFFTIEWQEDGTVGIKGSDGKYLSNKQTGILFSAGTTLEPTDLFRITIINRPLLVLKSEFGFVGAKGNQFICSKAKYDSLTLQSAGSGLYTIQGTDGKYWSVGEDTLVYGDATGTKFQFQFCGGSMMAIRTHKGPFLKGEQNGLLKACAPDLESATLWEF
ncbi:SING-like protein [Mya arenaria]|uniref:Fascin n=1 Tax=Mya arenaria TaxID=6604 RepID=A0ABY7DIC6_MYAAR|nr:protein singed-like [Mya arenaria]WAQ97441.1 SING-like protein [Mya arenaria]